MTNNRRTTNDGYTCGDDTRARVIASALRLFGQHGYDGTSTRRIAVDAGVNAPALHYYFAGKEGLYLACVEHMVKRFWSFISGAVAHAEGLLARNATVSELTDAYCAVQEGVTEFIFSSQEPADWLLIIVREQAGLGPDAGFRLMHEKINVKLMRVNSGIVGRLLCRSAEADETRLRAITLNGQLLTFLFMRRTLLTALNWDTFHARRVKLIKKIVRQNTESLLRAMMNETTRG